MLKQLNQYKARYKDLTERFIIAKDMNTAVQQLSKEEEPTTLQLAFEKVSVAVSVPDVQIVVASATDYRVAVAPTLLSDVKRGDTVYFVADVPDGLAVAQWVVNGTAISGSEGLTQLCWSVPDEETTEYTVQCVTEQTDEQPSPITNLTAVAGAYSIAAAWVNPSGNFDHALVTLQKADDLSFIHSDNVTGQSWSCDDVDPATDYIVGVTVVGINGKSSQLVSKQVTTEPAPAIQPDPVTDAVAAVSADVVSLTWTPPTSTYTGITVALKDSTGSVDGTKSLGVGSTTTTFDSLDDDVYSAEITVVNDDMSSTVVTITDITVATVPPNPVTSAVANVSGGTVTISWTAPTGDFDYVKVVLSSATSSLEEEIVNTLTSVDFEGVAAGTYTATLIVYKGAISSSAETVADIEVS